MRQAFLVSGIPGDTEVLKLNILPELYKIARELKVPEDGEHKRAHEDAKKQFLPYQELQANQKTLDLEHLVLASEKLLEVQQASASLPVPEIDRN